MWTFLCDGLKLREFLSHYVRTIIAEAIFESRPHRKCCKSLTEFKLQASAIMLQINNQLAAGYINVQQNNLAYKPAPRRHGIRPISIPQQD